jgi:hypothetical protein
MQAPTPDVRAETSQVDMDDDELIVDEIDEPGLEADLDADLDPELDVDVDDVLVDEPIDDDDEVAIVAADEDEEDEEEEAVPAARRRPRAGEEEEDEDVLNPDDVEADLDTILKDRIASGDDDEEDDEEPEAPGEPGERVAAKTADEFTCQTCFLIVHPRQFGRAGRLSCPEGYDPCSSIPKVEALLKKARKG